jgi:muramoyltetrapeptide carboxypeptidase
MYLTPRKLRRGAKIALVAPASPFKTDEVTEGMDIMREMGLVPVLGPCVRNLRSDNIHAGSLADRAAELNWAFSDPSINGVLAVCGGMGSAAILPYLDYRMIRASRKALLGMSDITALNAGILARAGLISINGQSPSIRLDKGEAIRRADSDSFRLTLRLMMSDEPWGTQPFDFSEYFPRTVCPGKATGNVIGGNADTFVHLLGTPYMPELTGTILFIEDVHKSGEILGREFLHMRLSGMLNMVNGIVIGEFAEVPKRTEEREPSIENSIEEYFRNGPPCTYGYPFSHGPLTGPVPIGAQCEIDADVGHVSFDFAMAR